MSINNSFEKYREPGISITQFKSGTFDNLSEVPTENPTGQNFKYQEDWAKKTVEYLNNLKQHLNKVDQIYVATLSAMLSDQFMDDLWPYLNADAQLYSEMSGRTMTHINRMHLDYIERILKDLGLTPDEIDSVFGKR